MTTTTAIQTALDVLKKRCMPRPTSWGADSDAIRAAVAVLEAELKHLEHVPVHEDTARLDWMQANLLKLQQIHLDDGKQALVNTWAIASQSLNLRGAVDVVRGYKPGGTTS